MIHTRILGIDTSLRSTGVGIVESQGSKMIPIYYGVIKTKSGHPLSDSLLHLQSELEKVIIEHQPQVVAVEGIFFARNVKTAMLLSHARGALIAECAKKGLSVYEYEPRKVKMAVAGYGAAKKEQMQEMVKTLLHLEKKPPHDAADALALAITHLHNSTSIRLNAIKPI
ncbi:MAG: crossover junction endodeoxyribonuclease RuvC [Kiritimatiellae bacterium]|jgi:crossover junction endodeoxyribonuclease RuvC|nr:crossover junction endodeoxyribonuclease RuvC [Kiritimatiellia bacterium]